MKLFHDGIFYDSEKDITLSHNDFKELTLPAIIKVPHGAWNITYDLLVSAFSTIKNLIPKLIVVLAPLHNGRIFLDDNTPAYTTSFSSFECKKWNIPIYNPKELIEEKLVNYFDEYFKEEASMEILFPFIAHTFPHIPILPLFADNQSCKLEIIIDKIQEKTRQKAIFLLSSNSGCASMWEKVFSSDWITINKTQSQIEHKVELGNFNGQTNRYF